MACDKTHLGEASRAGSSQSEAAEQHRGQSSGSQQLLQRPLPERTAGGPSDPWHIRRKPLENGPRTGKQGGERREIQARSQAWTSIGRLEQARAGHSHCWFPTALGPWICRNGAQRRAL